MLRLAIVLVVLLRPAPPAPAVAAPPPVAADPLAPVSGPPRRARGWLWRWWTGERFHHYLPRNTFTPGEVADALVRLGEHVDPACPRTVEVTWDGWDGLRRPRQTITVEQLRRVAEPERVRQVTLAWSYPPATDAEAPSTVTGRVVHHRRPGRLVVRQAGWARADFTRCAATLAPVRPAQAALCGMLMGPGPYLVILIGGIVALAALLAVLTWPEPPSYSTQVAVCVIAIITYGLYYAVLWSGGVSGTRLVEPEKVVGRSWISPGLIATAAAPVVALPALGVAIAAVLVDLAAGP